MTAASPDCELVSAYAAQGSEAAFRALVRRHVDLVYATALRQLGDSGLAEEVTQNVFVALARKAPRLGGFETLAGWLHRTTILEAKARIRSELRRRRREETAAELVILQREGASPFAAMVPLVDEALLSLRDRDRLALVLRFLEDRSLREVGVALGVDEDAARKRISRALDRLTEFFRRKDFAIAAGGGSAAVLANAGQAAPAGLAVSVGSAGLAAGGAATGLNLILFQLMALTKIQTAVLCALVAAAPLAWQWHAEARVVREQAELNTQLTSASSKAAELEDDIRRTQVSLLRARNEAATNETHLADLHAQLDGRVPPAVYHWDDNSPVARVPKRFLKQLSIDGVSNQHGQLSEQIKEVLQLTDAEAQNAQAAIDRFLAGYQAAQAAKMKRVEPAEKDLSGHQPEETRVFEMSAIGAKMGELRETLFPELEAAVGSERVAYLRSSLGDWMPLDDENHHGFSSAAAVFNFDRRVQFYQPQPGSEWMSWGLLRPNGESMTVAMQLADIPEMLRAELQDWIAIAKSKPVAK